MEVWVPVIVALISAAGSFLGVYFSNRKSAKESAALLDYRIGQLEAKVERHNNMIERTYALEEHVAVLGNRIDNLERRGA